MSALAIAPPKLAQVASEARAVKRAQKRERNPFRRFARAVTVVLAIVFATLGLGAGTAQAWPWTDMQEDITAFVTNFCGPEDVPLPRGHEGMDNLFGLNTGESTKRATVMPDTSGLGKAPVNGLERIQKAYAKKVGDIAPSYDRYGFSTLQWDSFGAGCFSNGYWFTGITNMMLNYFVMFPMMIAMATLQLAMGNILYTVFSGVISPFVSIFTAIFKGWALWLAPIGIIWAFARSRGNLRVVGKTAVWMIFIFGVFLWMGNSTSTVVTNANNLVTGIASSAATKMNEVNGVTTGEGGTAVDQINQSLWYGVPYQTWAEGQLGPEQAAQDRTRISKNEVSWGAVILNSKYIGSDEDGKKVTSSINKWNGLSYSPNESFIDEMWDNMKTKPGAWTKNKMWEKIPYLFNVKAICGDTSDGGGFQSSSGAAENKWFYGGSCDAASAGTASMIPYFTGTEYNSRLATAFSGGFAAVAVCLAVAASSIYLAVQKMLFYFLLLFGPIFLTIAMFGDEKRAAFAKRYGELAIANVLKQSVAVMVVLFIANSMSMLLYPPADEQFAALRAIPWMLKPTLALFFLIGLALFLIPLKKIVTGAVKGDTKVVDKYAKAPVDAAKTAAKVGAGVAVGAAAVAAVVATGGAAAPFVAQAGGMAMSAGRMAGRGGVGKLLTTAGRGANLASRVGGTLSDNKTKKEALTNLARGVFSKDENSKAMLSKIPGALDANGNMTPKGEAIMANAIKKTGQQGQQSARADALQKSYLDNFYKGHLAKTGEHHENDPNSPANMRAAKVAQEQERLAIRNEAKHSASREENMADATPAQRHAEQATRTQQANAEAVRENISGPGFAQDQNIKANVTVDGAKIVEQLGMTSREVAQNPAALLTGNAYEGGDTSKMDPRHPATSAMNDLRFAMMSGDQEGMDSASMRASEAIAVHGVPSQVSSLSAVAGTSEGVATAIGAMPSLSEDTPWQVRADSATTMQAALALVPEDSPVHEPMVNYVQALSSPTVDAQAVEGMRSLVIESAAPELFTQASTVDMSDAIQSSAVQVSAASAEIVDRQGASFGAIESAPAPMVTEAPVSYNDSAPAPAGYSSGPSFVRGDSWSSGGDYAPAADYGHDYPELPYEAVEAMPPAPMEGASPIEVERYQASMSTWRDEYGVDEPRSASAGPSFGQEPLTSLTPPAVDNAQAEARAQARAQARADAQAEARAEARARDRASFAEKSTPKPPREASAGPAREPQTDGLGEVSGMPTERPEDNSVPYNRSKRRRISGFFGGDEVTDGEEQKDGE